MADAKSWYQRKLGNPQPAQQPAIPNTAPPNQWQQAQQQLQQPNAPFQQQQAQGDGTTAGVHNMVLQGDRLGGARTAAMRQRVAGIVCPSCGGSDYVQPTPTTAHHCFACGYSDRMGSANVAE